MSTCSKFVLFVFAFALASSSSWALDPAIEAGLLNPVLTRINDAASKRLNVMVPDSYDESVKYFERAKGKLQRGKALKSVELDLAVANKALTNLEAKAEQAKLTLTPGMEARDDALQAKANDFNPKTWKKAESLFRRSASLLERENMKGAQNKQQEAIKAFRAVELSAIKSNYLTETATLIVVAKKDKIDRFAPKTVGKAQHLITEASEALNTDRYDTDRPRSLARDANYEAKHARYIAGEAKAIDNDDKSVEDLLIQLEQPLKTIAGELDIVIDHSQGPKAPTNDIVEAINYLKAEIRDLGVQLNDKNQQMVLLQGEAKERAALAEQIKMQDARRARFTTVEKMFTLEEAGVFRRGDDVTLRLVGLPFDSGKSVINPSGFALLAKVRQAIAVFPRAVIEIEGHTDSFGGDDANLVLSQARAESVRAYLLANMPELSPTAVQAFGYGEGRPIANNETKEGRAKNRRIDLLIKPVF